jgi:hypothetical protein
MKKLLTLPVLTCVVLQHAGIDTAHASTTIAVAVANNSCHLCTAEHAHRYYRDAGQLLRDHLRSTHFVCDVSPCCDSDAATVAAQAAFGTAEELRQHLAGTFAVAELHHSCKRLHCSYERIDSCMKQ